MNSPFTDFFDFGGIVGVVVGSEMRSGAEAALEEAATTLRETFGGGVGPCGGGSVCGRDGRPDGDVGGVGHGGDE